MKALTSLLSITTFISGYYLATHGQPKWADLCGALCGFSLFALVHLRKKPAREKAER